MPNKSTRKIGDNVISILQRDVLLFVTNLLTSIVVARTLGESSLGIWVILSIVPSYAEALGRTKADIAAVYFIGKGIYRREDVLYNLNIIALASAGTILLLILSQFDLIYNWLFRKEFGNYQTELLVLLIQIPLQFLYLNYSYFYISEENILVYNRMIVIRAWATSLTAIPLLTFTYLGIWSVLLAGIIGITSAVLYGWHSIDRRNWVDGRASKQISFDMIRYGFHFYLSGVLGQIQETGTNLLAVAYLMPAQMAFLSQGQGLGKLLNKVVDPVSTILFPHISRSGHNASAETTCTAFRLSSILILLGSLGMVILAKPLILILYGINFQPTAVVVWYLAPGLAIGGACGTVHSYFTGTGRANLIPRIRLLPTIIQIVLTWLFLQWWGLVGAAAAISLGLALYGLTILAVFVKVSKVSINQLTPGIADFRYLAKFCLSLLQKWQNRLLTIVG